MVSTAVWLSFRRAIGFLQATSRHWIEKAIERNDLAALANILRAHSSPGPSILSRLADKLDWPKGYKEAAFKWRRGRGRPRNLIPSDPIVLAMKVGDMSVIARELRKPAGPDPRVMSWLADQFVPPTEYHSHITIKMPRKERTRDPALHDQLMRIGREIFEAIGQGGLSVETALQDARIKEQRCSRSLSRSKARRAYDYFRRKPPE